MPCYDPREREEREKLPPMVCGLCKLLSKEQIKSIHNAWEWYLDHLRWDSEYGDYESKISANKEIDRLGLRGGYESIKVTVNNQELV